MTKRWSSGREHLPIFDEKRPLYESIFILVLMAALWAVFTFGAISIGFLAYDLIVGFI